MTDKLIEKCLLTNNEVAELVGKIEGSHLCTLAERIGFDIWQTRLLAKAIPIIRKEVAEEIHMEGQKDCPHVHRSIPTRPQRACDLCWEIILEKYSGKDIKESDESRG